MMTSCQCVRPPTMSTLLVSSGIIMKKKEKSVQFSLLSSKALLVIGQITHSKLERGEQTSQIQRVSFHSKSNPDTLWTCNRQTDRKPGLSASVADFHHERETLLETLWPFEGKETHLQPQTEFPSQLWWDGKVSLQWPPNIWEKTVFVQNTALYNLGRK